MSLGLEWQKIKRTGVLWTFLGGGILAAVVPVINLAARSEMYLRLQDSPVDILFKGNWQLMALLNILLLVLGACVLYHIEYADNGQLKMCSLPIKESTLFFSKLGLMTGLCLVSLSLEALGMAFCLSHWFNLSQSLCLELLKYFAYAFLLLLPGGMLALYYQLSAKTSGSLWGAV